MSAILVPSFYDLQDGFNKPYHRHVQLPSLDENSRKVRSRHQVTSSNAPTSPLGTKPTVFSMQQQQQPPQQQQQHKPSNNLSLLLPLQHQQSSREHRKLDRSMSEPVAQPQLVQRTSSTSGVPTSPTGQQANSSRYKTELCRPFEENGTCKYGDKCQFAHGGHELRTLARHPKYKTELCRTFHTAGFCPYGPRCHFIHNSEETKKSLLSSLQPGRNEGGAVQPPTTRPKALSIGSFSLGSAGELSPPSSLSASPTSLHSFFADDPFYSPAALGGHRPPQQQQACTAFSFSQDFAAALAKTPLRNHPGFGGSQPSLATAVGLQLAEMPERDVFGFESPPSPVDSLSSEIDGLTLGLAGGNSPVNCGSPLGLLGPRLPIFSRLATSDSE